jgi:hypothetical protein
MIDYTAGKGNFSGPKEFIRWEIVISELKTEKIEILYVLQF